MRRLLDDYMCICVYILGQDDLGLCGRTRKLNFLTHVKIVFWIEKMYVSPNSGGVLVHFKQKNMKIGIKFSMF